MINATLVTIHGFWSSPATWERLTAAWEADDQLRGLQIHPFGYPSPKGSRLPLSAARVPGYDDIAQTLATEYKLPPLAEAPSIAIVTHSQGGLILQRFLAWMLHEGRGQDLARIRTIVMLACPNGGSDYLRSVRRIFRFGRHPQAGSLEVLDRQVVDTQREVLRYIVNAAGVDEHQCRIPFHVYAGDSDNVVIAASGQGLFPGASFLAGDHFSILDPTAPGNRTADAVKYHLITDLPHAFARRSRPVVHVPSAAVWPSASAEDLHGLTDEQVQLLRVSIAALDDLITVAADAVRASPLSGEFAEMSARMQVELGRASRDLRALKRSLTAMRWPDADWTARCDVARDRAERDIRAVRRRPRDLSAVDQLRRSASVLRGLLVEGYPSLFRQES